MRGMAQPRAVVLLIAEYCSMRKDEQCLKEVFMRLSSGNVIQRRNAIDVISELIHISSDSAKVSPHLTWQDIANHLLKCLEDEEVVIQEQASNLLSLIDFRSLFTAMRNCGCCSDHVEYMWSSRAIFKGINSLLETRQLVLPGLVGLIYSSDESLQSSAADALIRVLKYHSLKVEVICMLLDNLSNVSHCLDHQETTRDEGGSGLDSDRVLRLIPEWSKSVHNWNCFIGPLIDKMFAEPSNAIIVRFLSYISEHLANAADIVLHHVLFNVKQQKECENRTKTNNDAAEMQQSLFEHLCPLLIIKMLPLQVFNDLNLSTMYGHLSQDIMLGCGDTGNGDECIAALLLNRTFCKFEFEDVRKLSAELCGRIHPQVLLPIVCSELEHATVSQDILTLKACLLSVCTSLVVRGKESFSHPAMLEIRKMIETVLLWPSLEGDPVSKAQHGCIDSLALMICAELQAGSFKDSTSEKISIVGKKAGTGYAASGISVLTYIIEQFIHDKNDIVSKSKSDNGSSAAPVPLSFRICLANVLISACQKVSDSCKKPFARKALPYLNQYVEVTMNLEIRVACIQVLFSAVYHLRSAVLPYASDLLKISVKALRKDSEKERMAGAKLMASLMASEDAILESISGELLEARSVLSTISLVDPSFELRKMCKKLLLCITST
ncbi:putative ARM repeat superfamily protein [Quillaja saponaria]|uniref:ARM repeat superfamily protein n=1 Tax=Quillaja saponaria TaxID=32244 RepID=A0AAD7PZV9_QUISA|nr:putative ARM repeat superfamily protein [Quillaja saponaria]